MEWFVRSVWRGADEAVRCVWQENGYNIALWCKAPSLPYWWYNICVVMGLMCTASMHYFDVLAREMIICIHIIAVRFQITMFIMLLTRAVCKKSNAIETMVSHYNVVIMGAMASQITSLTMVYTAVYSGANQRKHQTSVSLAFVRGIHRGPVNSPHKWPVTRKMFPFDDIIMIHRQSLYPT